LASPGRNPFRVPSEKGGWGTVGPRVACWRRQPWAVRRKAFGLQSGSSRPGRKVGQEGLLERSADTPVRFFLSRMADERGERSADTLVRLRMLRGSAAIGFDAGRNRSGAEIASRRLPGGRAQRGNARAPFLHRRLAQALELGANCQGGHAFDRGTRGQARGACVMQPRVSPQALPWECPYRKPTHTITNRVAVPSRSRRRMLVLPRRNPFRVPAEKVG